MGTTPLRCVVINHSVARQQLLQCGISDERFIFAYLKVQRIEKLPLRHELRAIAPAPRTTLRTNW
jgi:hypothetical protein